MKHKYKIGDWVSVSGVVSAPKGMVIETRPAIDGDPSYTVWTRGYGISLRLTNTCESFMSPLTVEPAEGAKYKVGDRVYAPSDPITDPPLVGTVLAIYPKNEGEEVMLTGYLVGFGDMVRTLYESDLSSSEEEMDENLSLTREREETKEGGRRMITAKEARERSEQSYENLLKRIEGAIEHACDKGNCFITFYTNKGESRYTNRVVEELRRNGYDVVIYGLGSDYHISWKEEGK